MRKHSLLLIGLVLGLTTFGQDFNGWKTLSKVTIEKRFDETLNFEIDYPTFSDEVKKLDGKVIELEGWMIPLEELQGESYFVLSSLPFANCFFCGGAGPETVAEVFAKEKIKFTEKRIKVRGKLKINADDPLKLMYILQEAEIVN
ncbi:hypothetical protein [Roseivirga thermotolerans]|uniref:hypothetical protein n=1 Tax=Roseivirga thermotolerans TaxID=1758176 RepID=UPI00273EC839|nr:hypothetical protein [Roseivirga thermotolerans]